MTQVSAQTSCEHQFDFWLGEWDVFDFSGGVQGDLAGTNRVECLFGGNVIEERWSGVGGLEGVSLSSYFALDGLWHQTWVDSSGDRLELAGLLRHGAMVLEGVHPGRQSGVMVLNRISWSLVQNDSDCVRQFWQRSCDGGQTWETVFDGLYVQKVVASSESG
jgi:hypothetical protein